MVQVENKDRGHLTATQAPQLARLVISQNPLRSKFGDLALQLAATHAGEMSQAGVAQAGHSPRIVCMSQENGYEPAIGRGQPRPSLIRREKVGVTGIARRLPLRGGSCFSMPLGLGPGPLTPQRSTQCVRDG